MFFSSLLVIPALAALSVSAHGLHDARHAHLHARHNSKRSGSDVVLTTGANGYGDGQVHTRLEIGDLAANRPEQWALFIQAMVKFKDTPVDSVTGYAEIVGIHGVPKSTWDGVEQCESCKGADGYAVHDSCLFPSWHRCYVSLYEQQVLGFVDEIANSYPDGKKESMLKAAATLRFPYWDFAAIPESGSVLPAVMASPQVTYQGAHGEETVANPFYLADIPDPGSMYYGPFVNWDTTLRWPSTNGADATSQDSSAVNAFDNIRASIQDTVYNLLTVCSDYSHFSNDAAKSSSTSCSTSLEAIHNTIHTTAGGPGSNGVSGGHMAFLPLASWDPAFFLLHCNVDRLGALWSAINPDSYGCTQTAPHNTWTIASGTQQGPDSPLEPFRKDASTYWTTNDVKDYASVFKYTYPEFSTSDGSRSAIIAYVNKLYGPKASLTASSISELAEKNYNNSTSSSTSSTSSSTSSSSSSTSSTSTSTKSTVTTTTASLMGHKHTPVSFAPTMTSATGPRSTSTSTSTSPYSNSTHGGGDDYQYVCNLNTPRYALNGSYYVYVFDGQPAGSDAAHYLTDKNLIGAVGVLGGGDMAAHVDIAASVPLTRYLQGKVDSGELSSMSHNVTVPYMAQHLNWKIVQQGAEVEVSAVPGFQASVYSGKSTPAGQDSLPQWSPLQPQVQVTKGKAGGLQVAPPAAYPAPSSNATSTIYHPTGMVPTSTPYSPPPPSYTGAASRASFGLAGVLAVAGLVAML